MSDAAIIAIVTGTVNAVATICTLLTLWVRLRYGVESKMEKVEAKVDDNTLITKKGTDSVVTKIDENTALTSEVKSSADRASQHVEGCDDRMQTLNRRLTEHEARITSMEAKLTAVAENLEKNVDSTRHEMRNHLQQVANKLDMIMLKDAIKKPESK